MTFKTSLLPFAFCLLTFAGLSNCAPSGAPPSTGAADPIPQAAGDWFEDRAEQAGLNFVHVNGMSGKFYYAEIIAPGVALFDYDNDGDLDVFLVQGQMLGTGKPLPGATLRGRLFRNDLVVNADGTRTLRFTDVTEASGIKAADTGWAWPPATSTTTAASIST